MKNRIHPNKQESGNLGLCLDCQQRPATNVVMLPFRAPIPGTGWGCVVCKQPLEGAISVLCDECRQADRPISRVCLGRPSEGQYTLVDAMTIVPFDHDYNQHPETKSREDHADD